MSQGTAEVLRDRQRKATETQLHRSEQNYQEVYCDDGLVQGLQLFSPDPQERTEQDISGVKAMSVGGGGGESGTSIKVVKSIKKNAIAAEP